MSPAPSAIHFGADVLCEQPRLAGVVQRVGLVTNDAARLATDVTLRSRVALQRAGVPLVRLFSPEHGLATNAADGAAVADTEDTHTGLPVHSLYGTRLRPDRAALADLDALLFDIPDVGARFYTYTWTLWHALAAAADAGVPLVVLDRPNPLGGDLARCAGPRVDPSCRSFLAEDDIPIVHSCTHGELARLWQQEHHCTADVRVIPMQGWSRAMTWADTGLPWVPTSPAMPSAASVALYPGLCFFEATPLSVGRGTDVPFQMIGAPWLDADRVISTMHERVPGVATPCTFTPTIAPHAGDVCRGVRLSPEVAAHIGPVAIGLHLLASVWATHAPQMQWTRYPTAANPSGEAHINRLLGRHDVARQLAHAPERVDVETVRAWTHAGDWRDRLARAGALLYSR